MGVSVLGAMVSLLPWLRSLHRLRPQGQAPAHQVDNGQALHHLRLSELDVWTGPMVELSPENSDPMMFRGVRAGKMEIDGETLLLKRKPFMFSEAFMDWRCVAF